MSGDLVAIRHIGFEDLGFLAAPLVAAGYRLRYHDAGAGEVDAADASLLVVLGGPMGVYERDRYPYLDDETRTIATRIAAGRPVLGICLGAQLIAHALGARVRPGAVKEIGFAPVRLTDAGRASPLAVLGAGQPVLHWHGDTFDLHEDTTLLASTDAYPNQAFARGPRTLALQFHIEAGGDIAPWLTGHATELRDAGVDPDGIRRDAATHANALREASRAVLADWLGALDG